MSLRHLIAWPLAAVIGLVGFMGGCLVLVLALIRMAWLCLTDAEKL